MYVKPDSERFECQKCDGVHDHQLKFVKVRCPVCKSYMVTVEKPENGWRSE